MESDPKQSRPEVRLPKTAEELQGMLEQARLEGAKLAITTIHHFIGNGINVVHGVGQMIQEDPESLSDLKPLILQAQPGLEEAVDTLSKLGKIRRLVTTEFGGHTILDLDASTKPTPDEETTESLA